MRLLQSMIWLLQVLLRDCSNDICKQVRDGDFLLRGLVRSPQGSASSTHDRTSHLS